MAFTLAITGGRGFLGKEITQQATEKKYNIHILSSRCPPKEEQNANLNYFHADLTKASETVIQEFLKGADALIHLAGKVSRNPNDAQEMMQLHVEGTRQLFNVAGQVGMKKIILLSTSGLIGISTSEKTANDDDPYALKEVLKWPYYSSKLLQEKLAISLAKEKKFPLLILRPSLLLGPGDHEYSSTGDVKNFLDRKILAMPGGGLSFVDVRDVANVCLHSIENGFTRIKPGSYRSYLLGGKNMSFTDFIKSLSRLSGVPEPRFSPSPKTQRLSAKILKICQNQFTPLAHKDLVSIEMGNYFWYINSTRSQKELGWAPRPFEKTLQITIDFIKSQPQN